jgi:hypothetical protein
MTGLAHAVHAAPKDFRTAKLTKITKMSARPGECRDPDDIALIQPDEAPRDLGPGIRRGERI